MRYSRQFRMNRRHVLAGMGALSAAVVVGCGDDDDDDPTSTATTTGTASSATGTASGTGTATATGTGQANRGGTFTYAMGEPGGWDASTSIQGIDRQHASHTHSQLVRLKLGADVPNGTTELEGDVAESWEQVDDTHLTFTIRPNVYWHDKDPVNGRLLTADDVKFTFDRIIAGAGNGPRYGAVESVTVIDEHTVQFITKTPYAPLLPTIGEGTHGYIYAPEAIEKSGVGTTDAPVGPEFDVGTGPFQLASFTRDVEYVHERHPKYFREGQPYLDGAKVRIILDTGAQAAEFAAGRLDAILDVTYDNAKALVDASGGNVAKIAGQSSGLSFKTDRAPFNDVNLRRAVTMAIPVEEEWIPQLYGGEGEQDWVVPRTLVDWRVTGNNAAEQWRKYNPTEAKKLVDASGIGDMELVLTSTPRYGKTHENETELIQQALKEIGLNVRLDILDSATFVQRVAFDHAYEHLAYTRRRGFAEVDYYAGFFQPDAVINWSGVRDERLNDLAYRQREAVDAEERKQLFDELQLGGVEQAYYFWGPVVPLSDITGKNVRDHRRGLGVDNGGVLALTWKA